MTVEKLDVLYAAKQDRRLLSHVPDATGQRSNHSRRGASDEMNTADYMRYEQDAKKGQRYLVDYPVDIRLPGGGLLTGRAVDISTTGILIRLQSVVGRGAPIFDGDVTLTFEITPGSMPEGYEMQVKKLPATVARRFEGDACTLYGMEFKKSLAEYAASQRRDYMLWISAFFIAVISLIILLMRSESIIYFKFNRWLYLYSIIAATFLMKRYMFASF